MDLIEEELIKYIAENLVNDPTQVTLNQRKKGRLTVLELHVAPEDMGRVIGKSGRVANAIRTLVRAADRSHGRQQIVLEIE